MKALLAIDGSTESAFGLETAASFEWPSGTELLVLTVLPSKAEWYGGPWAAGIAYFPPDHLRDDLKAERAALLVEAAARLRQPGLEVATRLIEGRAASVIVDTAREMGSDLIIVGARGHGAIEEALLGSVSAEVVDEAPCAVLVARRPSAGRVLIGTDGSEVAMSAAQFVGGCGLFGKSHVRVVHAIDITPTWWLGYTPGDGAVPVNAYASVVREGHRHGTEITAVMAAKLRADDVEADTVSVEGPAAAAILFEAKSWRADLVVVGTRGNGLLKRLLLGSTARSVLHHARASVLITKPTRNVGREPASRNAPVHAVPA
jgi:nucleotide-binding universal stress UspA family protein